MCEQHKQVAMDADHHGPGSGSRRRGCSHNVTSFLLKLSFSDAGNVLETDPERCSVCFVTLTVPLMNPLQVLLSHGSGSPVLGQLP